jgi:hypothetical protein
MAAPWVALIKQIIAGEDVSAAVTNRPTGQIAQRTEYLYERLQELLSSEALFAHDVNLEEAALVGDVVYWDATSETYKRAIAALGYSEAAGYWTISESSYAVGMVYEKTSNTTGHIVTAGFVSDFDLTDTIVGDSTAAGPYFLSMTNPGKVTTIQPPVGVFVLYNRDGESFHFGPTPRDVLEDHIHYRYDLYAIPAGDHNCVDIADPDGHNKVLNADSSLPGWLPADDPIFSGLAPAGAKFGYNISQHPELEHVWPPLPIDSVYIERNNRGVPVNTPECPLVLVDVHGIWWMQDCYGAAPWPPELPGCISDSSSSSESSSSSPTCLCETAIEYMPGHAQNLDEMHLRIWFVKMVAKTDQTVVTQLDPCDDSQPIVVADCEGAPASTGKLCLSFDWDKLTKEYPISGYGAVKDLTGAVIKRGPVITGIKPGVRATIDGIGTAGVDFEKDTETGIYRGEVQIGLDASTDQSEGSIELVALNSVRKDYDETQQRLTLHFPGGFESSIRGRINLSRINLSNELEPDELDLRLWFWFVSRDPAGAMPALTATYRRYPRPTTILELPDDGDEEDIEIGGTWTPLLNFTDPNQYGEATTPVLAGATYITVGDIIDFTIGWDGTGELTDGFGIIRMGYEAVMAV